MARMSQVQAARRKRKKRARRQMEAARLRGSNMKLDEIDYKNVPLLQRLTTAQGKLFSRKRTGLPSTAQRQLTLAVKRARYMALMPYVS